ncbi:MAG: hypothetical protein ACOX15_07070 [Tepidanaerobacteraceae bacterium]
MSRGREVVVTRGAYVVTTPGSVKGTGFCHQRHRRERQGDGSVKGTCCHPCQGDGVGGTELLSPRAPACNRQGFVRGTGLLSPCCHHHPCQGDGVFVTRLSPGVLMCIKGNEAIVAAPMTKMPVKVMVERQSHGGTGYTRVGVLTT